MNFLRVVVAWFSTSTNCTLAKSRGMQVTPPSYIWQTTSGYYRSLFLRTIWRRLKLKLHGLIESAIIVLGASVAFDLKDISSKTVQHFFRSKLESERRRENKGSNELMAYVQVTSLRPSLQGVRNESARKSLSYWIKKHVLAPTCLCRRRPSNIARVSKQSEERDDWVFLRGEDIGALDERKVRVVYQDRGKSLTVLVARSSSCKTLSSLSFAQKAWAKWHTIKAAWRLTEELWLKC